MSIQMRRPWTIGLAGLAAAAIIALGAYLLVSPMMASADAGVVQDPKGDVKSATESANQVGAGTPEDVARPYLDIKSVKVTRSNGNGEYTFSMTLGAPVPGDLSTENCYGLTGPAGDTTTVLVNPPSPGACFFAWNWDLSEEGSEALSPTVRWRGGAFQGIAFRSSGPPILFDDFRVSGAQISATLDAATVESHLDVSDGFDFRGVTRNHRIDFGFGGDPLVGVADRTGLGSLGD